jgi:hypothetical protein
MRSQRTALVSRSRMPDLSTVPAISNSFEKYRQMVSLRRKLHSTGFLFALEEAFVDASSVPFGFEKRVDAAIYRTASKAKTLSQSSEHSVVATSKHVGAQTASA